MRWLRREERKIESKMKKGTGKEWDNTDTKKGMNNKERDVMGKERYRKAEKTGNKEERKEKLEH